MSILAQQDIRNATNSGLMGPSTAPTAWQQNLGATAAQQPQTTGFGGQAFAAPGLSFLNIAGPQADGPRGILIRPEYATNPSGQYGPPSFTRLTDREDSHAKSILGAFAIMIAGVEGVTRNVWGLGGTALKMKNTFTSGNQTRSLRIATVGHGNTPIASGGTFEGYQAGQKYGMHNYNISEIFAAASDDTLDKLGEGQHTPFGSSLKGSEATEEVNPPVPIEDTGLRNIPGMA